MKEPIINYYERTNGIDHLIGSCTVAVAIKYDYDDLKPLFLKHPGVFIDEEFIATLDKKPEPSKFYIEHLDLFEQAE